ncbi:hypothetical protein [Neisseria weixii]|uniref:hypothetical protein n=1 Tax=Neisseria weixii TaxID=1853276 RepID=UPI0035A17CB6
MRKFKFGDLVSHEEHGDGVIVKHNGSKADAFVIFEGDSYAYWFDKSELNLIPDPDTDRLEWLYEHGLSKIAKESIFGKGIQIQTIDDLREAIDDERYRRENPSPLSIESPINNTDE